MLYFINRFFSKTKQQKLAENVFKLIVSQSRKKIFYTKLSVPDTIDGRFELIVLHTYLVVRCLKNTKYKKNFGRDIMTKLFDDFDLSLRELGVGDMGMGRKIKVMADSFYGRCKAYEEGLKLGDKELEAAITRNIYGGKIEREVASILVDYVKSEAKYIENLSFEEINYGKFNFREIKI
ncbi:MAG: hypothetical protein CMM49_01530 [Rhodospirillaceae bacterium]|nr:hypothetical protein [Rhodospirillaceae bacterium]|tara:strand:+ start:1135 stop:1671 length:537 start_codon:yes stop_codon:yes gene_type:complete